MPSQHEGVGSSYGEELSYVFGLPISGVWPHHTTEHYTRAESVLSAITISYWANFVKDGSVLQSVLRTFTTQKEIKTIPLCRPFLQELFPTFETDRQPFSVN